MGEQIRLTIFGESHGPSIGVVMDGLPAGIELDLEAIEKEMKRRAPGTSKLATPRKESDSFIIERGFSTERLPAWPCAPGFPTATPIPKITAK